MKKLKNENWVFPVIVMIILCSMSCNEEDCLDIQMETKTWLEAEVNFDHDGWHIGDFDGDKRTDIFKYHKGECGAQMFLSDDQNICIFKENNCWTPAGLNFNHGGWHIGDFNGDGMDDIFRYQKGECGAEVFLSNKIGFPEKSCWTLAGVNFHHGGWHIGDFNGDGMDDIFRYQKGECGAEVFLSDGESFSNQTCWTPAGLNFNHGGWYIGDFNGDGKDDIFRYQQGECGAEVFLSDGESFSNQTCWTPAGVNFQQGGWHIGDFNGDGKDDIFRYQQDECGADVFLSNGERFSESTCWTFVNPDFDARGWHIGDFNGDGKDDIFRYIEESISVQVFLSNGERFID